MDVFTIEDCDQRRLVIIEEAAPEGTLWSMMEAQPACNSRMQLQRQSTWGLFPFVEVPPCFTDDIRRGASKPSEWQYQVGGSPVSRDSLQACYMKALNYAICKLTLRPVRARLLAQIDVG